MNIVELGFYKGYSYLVGQLVNLHKTKNMYSLKFDVDSKNTLFIFYDKETRTYNFYFKLEDEKVLESFIKLKKNLDFYEIKGKEKFIDILRDRVSALVTVMQNLGYKFTHNPDVTLHDLEHIDELLGSDTVDDFEELEITDSDIERQSIINSVLIYHNLLTINLERLPYEKNDTIKIRVKDIGTTNINLFPPEDKEYEDSLIFNISVNPNLYFPQVVTFRLVKEFKYKDLTFQIIYSGNVLLSYLGQIAKSYYSRYKKSNIKNERILDFSKELLGILKTPFNSSNFGEGTTKDSIINNSQCKKCGSRSGMFTVLLSSVNIGTTMGMYVAAKLLTKNIINYQDILELKCGECNNEIIVNTKKINNILKSRDLLGSQDWTNSTYTTPLLDDPTPRDVIVKYDTMSLEVEFDLTNPLIPKLHYQKILSTGEVIGWTDRLTGEYKTFYEVKR